MNGEKRNKIMLSEELDDVLPKYEPIKLSGKNLAQNYVSAFNTGMNIYQCVNYLQGNIDWTIKAVNDVVKSWNVKVDETLEQSIAITKETTTEQFNIEWTNKQPELIDQVNTLTTSQFNELVEDKLAYVTPQMYGAVGDGISDDTNAFKNALSSSKTLVIPNGTYLISEPLNLYKKTIVGTDREKTKLLFNGTSGLNIDREVFIENLCIAQNDRNKGYGINFKNSRGDDTVTRVIIQNVQIIYFEYGIRAVDASSWSNSFRNLTINGNTHALYFDSIEKSLSSSHFGNIFDTITGDSRNDGYAMYFRGCSCKLINCNFSTNFVNSVYTSLSHLFFDSCYFESDISVNHNGAIMQLDGSVEFNNCRFLDNFAIDGQNYFMMSINKGSKKYITFNQCQMKSYSGSKMTSLVNPSFCDGSDYGCVICENNNFDLTTMVYATIKPYILNVGSNILLRKNNISKDKLKRNTIYMYEVDTQENYKPAYYNGTNILDMNGNILE